MPRLSAALINQVCASASGPICVPAHHGRRGHPVSFAWQLAAEVASLGPEQGVNALLLRHPVREIAWGTEADWQDLDTPADYRRLRE